MQHFASKLLHEDGGRYQRVSCTQSGRRSRRQMMSTKATTLNSEQNVIKVSLHLLVVVHLTQHKLPATLCVAHAHLPLALVVLLLLARRVVPVDHRQHWSCRHHCNYRRSLTEMYVKMSNKSTRLQTADWASAVSAKCDYYYKLYSLPGNINLLSRPTEMQLDNERNAIHV